MVLLVLSVSVHNFFSRYYIQLLIFAAFSAYSTVRKKKIAIFSPPIKYVLNFFIYLTS